MLKITREKETPATKELLAEKVAKLTKLATKNGLLPPTMKAEEFFVAEKRRSCLPGDDPRCPNGPEIEVKLAYWKIEIEADTEHICKPGYALAGLAQSPIPGEDVNRAKERIVTRFSAGEGLDLSPFKRDVLTCDHCKAARRRNTVAIVLDESSKRIFGLGTDCLVNYVPSSVNGVAILENLIAFVESLSEVSGEEGGYGSYGPTLYALDTVLFYTAYVLRETPFVPSKCDFDYPTKSFVGDLLSPRVKMPDGVKKVLHEMKEKLADESFKASLDAEVTAVKAWVKSLLGMNDFESNLKTAFTVGTTEDDDNAVVSSRTFGLVVASVHCYKRDVEKQIIERKRAAETKFVGEVGKRIVFKGVTLAGITPYDNQYGTSYRTVFTTPEGGFLVWWASNCLDAPYRTDGTVPIGSTLDLKATVKKHEDYKGQKQTVVTRGVVSNVERPALEAK